jgi:hypothetical protein
LTGKIYHIIPRLIVNPPLKVDFKGGFYSLEWREDIIDRDGKPRQFAVSGISQNRARLSHRVRVLLPNAITLTPCQWVAYCQSPTFAL